MFPPDIERGAARRVSILRGGLAVLLVLPALLAVPACSETDPLFVTEIGTTRIMPTSPSLGQQKIKDAETTMQTAVWNFSKADLHLGERTLDLLVDGKCQFSDTAPTVPFSKGRCNNGIVIDSFGETVEATVDLAFSMTFSRAEPVDLPATGDFDDDGVPNRVDTCPLVYNPGQGIKACSLTNPTSGQFYNDSDADGWIDQIDNCVWISNPDQENTKGLAALGIDDLIGDACVEQTAQVLVNGSTEVVLTGVPISFVQPQDVLSFVVIEVDHKAGVECDFDAGTCVVPEKAIRVCQKTSAVEAVVGCP
jgi:hypothetical protein